MTFRFLVAAIDFDGVAQGLKRVEGKADGQNEAERFDRIVPVDCARQRSKVGVEEIEILEDTQKTKAENNAPGRIVETGIFELKRNSKTASTIGSLASFVGSFIDMRRERTLHGFTFV